MENVIGNDGSRTGNAASEQPNYLFLCAVGRSGTTIFRRSLGLHPQIDYNGHENNLVQDVVEVAKQNCELKSRKFAMVVEQEEYDAAFKDLIVRLIWPTDSGKPIRFAAINPTGDLLDYLSQLFPGCKIICLVRNGIEVVASRMKYASFSNQSFEHHCRTWLRSEGVVNWGEQNPDRFRLVRHEWFYDPERLKPELDQLWDWLGIEPSSLPFDNIGSTLVHPTGDDLASGPRDLKLDEKREFYRTKREKWRAWSASERHVFQAQCGRFMKKLGHILPWVS